MDSEEWGAFVLTLVRNCLQIADETGVASWNPERAEPFVKRLMNHLVERLHVPETVVNFSPFDLISTADTGGADDNDEEALHNKSPSLLERREDFAASTSSLEKVIESCPPTLEFKKPPLPPQSVPLPQLPSLIRTGEKPSPSFYLKENKGFWQHPYDVNHQWVPSLNPYIKTLQIIGLPIENSSPSCPSGRLQPFPSLSSSTKTKTKSAKSLFQELCCNQSLPCGAIAI